MIDFLSHTWFVWWTLAVVVVLRWLHVIAPDNSWDESEPDQNDEEFQYFSEYADSPWRQAPADLL
jgi:hypothetical protein